MQTVTMSALTVGAIGRPDPGSVSPVGSVRPARTGRTILVRPITGTTGADPTFTRTGDRTARRATDPVVRGTAYQTNSDGDSAVFSSKLDQLAPEERDQLHHLKKRDTEVRSHEQAHMSAAGGLAIGGPNYDTKTGPDGNRYAVGGHVSIDTSPGATPAETIAKAQRMKQAALAPSDPSGQDRAVAAKAMRMEAEARQELSRAGKMNPSQPGGTSGTGHSDHSSSGGMLDLVA